MQFKQGFNATLTSKCLLGDKRLLCCALGSGGFNEKSEPCSPGKNFKNVLQYSGYCRRSSSPCIRLVYDCFHLSSPFRSKGQIPCSNHSSSCNNNNSSHHNYNTWTHHRHDHTCSHDPHNHHNNSAATHYDQSSCCCSQSQGRRWIIQTSVELGSPFAYIHVQKSVSISFMDPCMLCAGLRIYLDAGCS